MTLKPARFIKKTAWVLLFVFAMSLLCGVGYAEKILLITIDTMQADLINNKEVTPNLNKLKKDSKYFQNAFCASNYTASSHASIFTSLPVSKHGLTTLDGLRNNVEYLPEILNNNKFKTHAEVSAKGLWCKGFKRGFDVFRPCDVSINKSGDFGIESTDVTQHFIEWFDKQKKDEKFFIWLHYFDPHFPYCPNKEFNKFSTSDPKKQRPNNRNPKEEDFKLANEYYKGEVYSVDYAVGMLIDYLKKEKLYDEFMIIITNDHGESIDGCIPYFGHGSLCDDVAKSLILIKYPNSKHKGINKLLVSDLDIAPTILDYFKIPIPKQFTGFSLLNKFEREYVIDECNNLNYFNLITLDSRCIWKNKIFECDSENSKKILQSWINDIDPTLYDRMKKEKIGLSPAEKEQLKALGYL
ncbi:sulfatase [bacterium]|nr:sulfatase [bacterium]